MIDVNKLKHKWHAEWDYGHPYVRGDIVRFKDSTYVCIRDIPLEFTSDAPTAVSTSSYYAYAPGVHLKTKDPKDSSYWLQFTPGTKYFGAWRRNWLYSVGDIVDLAGDLYICTKDAGSIRNLYPEINTDYFVLIFRKADRDRRYVPVSTCNEQPLGWKYNNGEQFNGQAPYTPGLNFIDVEGNAYNGGYHCLGYGSNNGTAGNRRIKTHIVNFTYVDWWNSTDCGGSGRMTTPDGRPPKVIQHTWGGGSDGVSLWVMNNGEVYSAGYNGHGQLGISSSTGKWSAGRVSASDTTDWLGNTIPYSFNNTKIIKVASSGQNCNDSAQTCFALDEFGGVWAWGYNGVAGNGLGSNAITNSTSGGNMYTDNGSTYRPRRIPNGFFNDKRIVDIMSFGGSRPRAFAVDEDGDLWAWGNDRAGELGLGERQDSDGWSYFPTPQKVDVDWKRYGGIKKIMQCGVGSGWNQRVAILDGQNKLWVAGMFGGGGSAQSLANAAGSPSGAVNRTTYGIHTRFTRLLKGWWRDHDIDNFWIHGDTGAWVMYIREKGTGFTYSLGHNVYGVLGQGMNHRYWYGGDDSTNYTTEPGLIEGPVNVVKSVNTNTGAPSTTTSSNSYITVNLITEDGRSWGAGRNDYGSLALGHSGAGYYDQQLGVYWNNGNLFRVSPMTNAPGCAVTHVSPWGDSNRDACTWFNESGQVMIAGADGNNDGAYDMWQGSWWGSRYYNNTSSNPGNYHEYSMHSYPMG